MAKKWWQYITGDSDEDDSSSIDFNMFDFFPDAPSEPSYNIFDFGNLEQAINDANARDFLRGMTDVTATEGSGVAGTGILTQGTNIPTNSGGKDFLKSVADYVSKNKGQVGLMAALAALGALSKAPPSGGGVGKRYAGPAAPLTRTITQGRYGPIAQYAAQGGIMHAYAHGGQVKPVAMEDGGFVMTKRAVDGAGGPQGIQALLPGARPIRGPGTGTSDSIPAYIQGRNGTIPARVSNGEAYVPRRAQPPGGTRELYAMMRQLERRA